MQVLSFDHVAVVVRSLPAAIELYVDVLGAEFLHGGDVEERAMRNVQLRLGGRKLEILQPLTAGSYLHRFLDRFGEGFHHMTLLVPDIHAAAAELSASGFEVVDLDDADPRWQEAYVRPKSGFGTLIQLAETTLDWERPRGECTLDDVLAGQLVWIGQDCVRRTPEMGPPLDQAPGRPTVA